MTNFLQAKLHLKVNKEKSAVAPVEARKFLGHRLLPDGSLGIAPESLSRVKARIRQITRRNRGISLTRMIAELNAFLAGWVTYFRYARCKSHLQRIDAWLRRKLRCFRLKQCQRSQAIADFLESCGVPACHGRLLAGSSRGWWRKSHSPQAATAMTLAWFKQQGLALFAERYLALQARGNRRGT